MCYIAVYNCTCFVWIWPDMEIVELQYNVWFRYVLNNLKHVCVRKHLCCRKNMVNHKHVCVCVWRTSQPCQTECKHVSVVLTYWLHSICIVDCRSVKKKLLTLVLTIEHKRCVQLQLQSDETLTASSCVKHDQQIQTDLVDSRGQFHSCVISITDPFVLPVYSNIVRHLI